MASTTGAAIHCLASRVLPQETSTEDGGVPARHRNGTSLDCASCTAAWYLCFGVKYCLPGLSEKKSLPQDHAICLPGPGEGVARHSIYHRTQRASLMHTSGSRANGIHWVKHILQHHV